MQLYLGGYGLELDDLKALRTWGSKTPGHPEYGHTDGVEITTGPLGQGLVLRRRLRLRRALRARPVRPGCRSRHEPVRPLHLRHRRRRRPAGGRHERGILARRPPGARQPRSRSTTATRSRSRTTRTSPSPRMSPPATRPTTGTCRWSTGRRPASTSRTSHELNAAIEAAKAVTDKPSLIILKHHHRLAVAREAEHRQDPRLRARRRGARRGQGGARLRPRPDLRGRAGRLEHTRWRARTRQPRRTPSGRTASTPGPQANPERKALLRPHLARCAARTASRRRCPSSRRARTCRPAPRPARCCQRARRGDPRTVGRLGRPRRVEQHHDRGREVVRPAGALDARVGRRPYGRVLHFGIREHAMGAIVNGIVAARQHPRVRRHVPDLQRLHAPGRAARGADEGAVHLRLDARLRRARRRRPDPPADRAARGAARHPGPRRRAPGDANEVAWAWKTILERRDGPGRASPSPARTSRCSRAATARPSGDTLRLGRERRQGRVRARRGAGRHARRDPHRHRLRGAARRRRPRAAEGRGHQRPRRSRRRAWSGSRSRTPRTANRCCPKAVTARVSVEAGVALTWRGIRRRRRPLRVDRALRRIRRLQDPVPRVRHHDRSAVVRRQGIARPPSATTRTRRKKINDRQHHHPSHSCPRKASASGSTTSRVSASSPAASQKLIDDTQRRRRDHEPDDLRQRLAKGDAYDAQVAELAAQPAPASTTRSSRSRPTTSPAACDIFRPVFDATNGVDGRVSIEVEPDLAHDTAGTIAQAKQLWAKVDRPNVDDQDSGDVRRPRGDHRADRRWASASTSR